MNRFCNTFLLAGLLVMVCVPELPAVTIFYDDFEESDPAITLMPDTPPIGLDWTDYYPGSTQHWIAENPAPDAVNSSALGFYMERSMSQPNAIMQVPISDDDQATIAANGSVTFEMKFYNIQMEDTQGIALIGTGNQSGTLTPRAFSPTFHGNGTVTASQYTGDTWINIDTGLTYTNDAWHTAMIVADFATDTYDLWIDGQTTDDAQGLPFANQEQNDLTTIGRIAIATGYKPAAFYMDDVEVSVEGTAPLAGDLNGDGFVGGDDLDIVRSFWGQNVPAGDLEQGDPSNDGFVGGDDLDIVRANWGQGTPPAPNAVPEPSTGMLVMLSGASMLLTRRRRIR